MAETLSLEAGFQRSPLDQGIQRHDKETLTRRTVVRLWLCAHHRAMLERDERLFEIKHFPESLGMHLRSNVEGAPASTKLWTDAWLAALAEASGMTMVTFDRGFRKFSLSSLELLRI